MAENGKPGSETIILEIDDAAGTVKVDGEEVDALVFAVTRGPSGTFRTRAKSSSGVSHLLSVLGMVHQDGLKKEVDLW